MLQGVRALQHFRQEGRVINDPKTVSDLGEFRLIDRLKAFLPHKSSDELVIGIGDDAAAVRIDDRRLLLATCDIQIAGTHFRPEWFTAHQLGRRAAAVNLSDIAAMGGSPKWALVSLALPPDLNLAYCDDLFRGLADALNEYGATIIGGNLSRADKLVVDLFLLGEIDLASLLTRSGARPGDRIMLSGCCGLAAAGLRLLQKYGSAVPERFRRYVDAYLQPTPRIALGRAIAASGWATTMIDVSDGLAADLNHICEASGVGAEVHRERLPLPPELADAADVLTLDPLDLALNGGEDYELLFTIRPETPAGVLDEWRSESGLLLAEIGAVVTGPPQICLTNPDGKRESIHPAGWDHFGASNADNPPLTE